MRISVQAQLWFFTFGLALLGIVNADSKLVFADAKAGSKLLAVEDEFTNRLSPFDLQVRTKAEEVPSKAAFLAYIGKSAIDWPAEEKRIVEESWARVIKRLEELKIQLPDSITVIRTNGTEEPGAAYTRGTNIMFHPGSIADGKRLDGLMAHELFHIISRADTALRDQLYAIIGFTPCGEIDFPKLIAPKKITNPDAPVNQHAIKLEIDGKIRPALPILLASREFNAEANQGLFAYLQMQFLVIEKDGDRWKAAKKQKSEEPYVVSKLRVKNFHEQIGGNTGYIIHPEEILADNFKHLVLETKDLKSPEIVEKMRAVFSKESLK